MTVIKRGIVSTQRFDAVDGSAVLQIPIDDGDVPNVVVQIDMVGATARIADDGTPLPDSPPRPAYATGQITLAVPPVTRALTVTATPAADAVAPGTDTSVTVQVVGPDGAPVSDAAVAVVVVDEAVLALTGYQLADPLDAFYADLWSTVTSTYSRSSILLTRSDLLGGIQQGGDDSAEASATTMARRARRSNHGRCCRADSTRPVAPPPQRRSRYRRSTYARTSTRSPCMHPTARPMPAERSPSTCRCPTTSRAIA